MKASQISRLVLRAADVALDNTDGQQPVADRSFGDKAKEVLSNKFVIGGIAAVAVAGAAYGTYRGVQAIRSKKAAKAAPAAAAAPAAELTPEEQISQARTLLTSAETKLSTRGKARTAEAAAA